MRDQRRLVCFCLLLWASSLAVSFELLGEVKGCERGWLEGHLFTVRCSCLVSGSLWRSRRLGGCRRRGNREASFAVVLFFLVCFC